MMHLAYNQLMTIKIYVWFHVSIYRLCVGVRMAMLTSHPPPLTCDVFLRRMCRIEPDSRQNTNKIHGFDTISLFSHFVDNNFM